MRKPIALVLITLMSLVAANRVMSAHMKIEKANPVADSTVTAPPPSIQVWFSEAPDLKVSTLTMSGASGPVSLTGLHVMDRTSLMAMVADAMPDGVYTIAWQSAGNDGHVQRGTLSFTLKRVP